MREGAFKLHGPFSGTISFASLEVIGAIGGGQEGSTIHITAAPVLAIVGFFMCIACGVVVGGLFAILDRAIVLPLSIAAVSAVPAAVLYTLGALRAKSDFARLLKCLQMIFAAQISR